MLNYRELGSPTINYISRGTIYYQNFPPANLKHNGRNAVAFELNCTKAQKQKHLNQLLRLSMQTEQNREEDEKPSISYVEALSKMGGN
ncbi:uncharacterized protein G2W53_002649 [Senna tora]|uniref:Uncharacterized protein n=1 Tax=Senna tora TaxID=362788 RepID=A0A834X8G9_9FABA|nr:uncharacterized protein G2W53_002649 [Senna tora]